MRRQKDTCDVPTLECTSAKEREFFPTPAMDLTIVKQARGAESIGWLGGAFYIAAPSRGLGPPVVTDAYSCRSAINGSIEVTWRAGMKQAAAATAMKSTATLLNVSRSVGLVL